MVSDRHTYAYAYVYIYNNLYIHAKHTERTNDDDDAHLSVLFHAMCNKQTDKQTKNARTYTK